MGGGSHVCRRTAENMLHTCILFRGQRSRRSMRSGSRSSMGGTPSDEVLQNTPIRTTHVRKPKIRHGPGTIHPRHPHHHSRGCSHPLSRRARPGLPLRSPSLGDRPAGLRAHLPGDARPPGWWRATLTRPPCATTGSARTAPAPAIPASVRAAIPSVHITGHFITMDEPERNARRPVYTGNFTVLVTQGLRPRPAHRRRTARHRGGAGAARRPRHFLRPAAAVPGHLSTKNECADEARLLFAGRETTACTIALAPGVLGTPGSADRRTGR